VRRAGFERILAGSNLYPCRLEPSFQIVNHDRLPSAEVHGIVSLIVTVMQVHQIVCPHITALSRIIELSNLVKMLAIVGQQGIINAQNALRLHLSSSQTGQER
jgi:hypothetical protein